MNKRITEAFERKGIYPVYYLWRSVSGSDRAACLCMEEAGADLIELGFRFLILQQRGR